MAVFQSIQKHPVLLASILGGGLVLMIIMFGFDDYNGFFQGDRDTVLNVNGNKVSWAQYETERQRQSDFIQSFYNQDVNKAEISHQINNQVYQQFVQEIVLDEQLEEVGITVSDAEINELAQGSHISPVMTQIFGAQAQMYGQTFATLIAENSFEEFQQRYNAPYMTYNNWLVLEKQIKDTRKAQKYNAILAAAVQPNALEAMDVFNGDNTDVAFTYVRKRAMEVADSLVSVSSSDIKAYYESHKESFKQQQKTREISYIAVALHPSVDDENAVLANLQKGKEEFSAGDCQEMVSANSVIPYIDAYLNDNTFRGELKEFVDGNAAGAVSEPQIYKGDIRTFIGEQSENDESLSEYYWMARIIGKQQAPDSVRLALAIGLAADKDSVNNVIAAGHPDTTWYTNLSMIGMEDGLRNQIAATRPGATFTYDFTNAQKQEVHICGRVIEKTANVAQSKVAIYAEKINPSSKTRRNEYARLNDFVNDFTTAQQMQDSALSRGFRMLDATVASSSYNINQVRECRPAVRFAFEAEAGKVSEIFEESGYLIVVVAKGEVEQGYASLDNKQLVDYIRMQVLPEKKVAYLMSHDFANVSANTIEAYAAATATEAQEATRVNFNMNSISGLGLEPKVIGAAIKNAEGTVVGPIAGNNCVVVIKVGQKTEKGLEYNEADCKAKVSGSVYRNPAGAATQLITSQADITDNRIRFY